MSTFFQIVLFESQDAFHNGLLHFTEILFGIDVVVLKLATGHLSLPSPMVVTC